MRSKNCYELIHCSCIIKKLILKDCIIEFLKNHPELEGTKITHNQILTSMTRHYLGGRYYELYGRYEGNIK